MRITVLLAIALALLATGGYLFGSQAEPVPPGPQQLYAESQALQAQLEAVDTEIGDLEYQVLAQRRALDNYKYVRAQNGLTLERLEQWVDSP